MNRLQPSAGREQLRRLARTGGGWTQGGRVLPRRAHRDQRPLTAVRAALGAIELLPCACRRISVDRGCGLRDRQRDPMGRPLEEDRTAARRRRLLLLPPAQGGQHRRRRHADDPKSRMGRAVPLLRQHAMSVPDTVRHGSAQVIFESYPTVGFNYRMTDIQAAVGREQLKRLPAILQQRRRLAARYADLAADIPGLGLPAEPAWARSNWQSYCVRLPKGLDQRSVMQAMLDEGISTRRGIMCSHREARLRRVGAAPGTAAVRAGTGRMHPAAAVRADERPRAARGRRRVARSRAAP